MCPPFVVDMDAVEGNDKVCGITAFLTTAYAILPQMSRSYVVFGKVITLPFTTYIFVKLLDDGVNFVDSLSLLFKLPFSSCQLLCLFIHRPADDFLDKFIFIILHIGNNFPKIIQHQIF